MDQTWIDIAIFAAVAAFLIYRLRSVLGERNGSERPPRMPLQPAAAAGQPTARIIKTDTATIIETDPDLPLSLDARLKRIMAVDATFTEKAFLLGARRAFEMMIDAYNNADTATLKMLLGGDLYFQFTDALQKRSADAPQTILHRITDIDITDAALDRSTALVSVRFVSDQTINDVRQDVTDHWQFARNTRNPDPNWQVVDILES